MTEHTDKTDSAGRRLVAFEFISLDGVIEAPHEWQGPYFSEDMGEVIGAGTAEYDALLLGRVTYEGFAAAWPTFPDDEPGAKEMNAAHKYVVSNTLTEGSWAETTVISGGPASIADQIREAKAQSSGLMALWGSAKLLPLLIEDGLLDELRLFVHPLVVGSGQRLFEEGPRFPFRLVQSEALSSGVMHLVYEPVRDAAADTGTDVDEAETA